MIDAKSIQHGDDVIRLVPALRRDPAIGRKQTYRKAKIIHRDCNEMAQGIITAGPFFLTLVRHWFRSLDHALFSQKQMKVPVLTLAMIVIIILAVSFRIINVSVRIMIPFIKRTLIFQYLPDDVQTAFSHNAVAFQNVLASGKHFLAAFQWKRFQIYGHDFNTIDVTKNCEGIYRSFQLL